MTKEEAIQKAHAMSAYIESEQADEKTHDFDDLWQSLYDICQLATYGIVELTQEEIDTLADLLSKVYSNLENE